MLLAHHDLGGTGPTLLMLHANGHLGCMLKPLVDDALRAHFHCIALDLPGQGSTPVWPSGPGSMTVDDVVASVYETVTALGLHGCLFFGQSFGGTMGLLVEAAHPGTFAAIYVYEPPVFTTQSAARIEAWQQQSGQPSLGLVLRDMASKRRATFASAAAAAEQLGSKPPFSLWDPRVLQLYLTHGLRPVETGSQGVALVCTPENEAAFQNLLVPPPSLEAARVTCPVMWGVGLAGKGVHGFLSWLGQQVWSDLPKSELQTFKPLSHFGPQEQPGAVGVAVAAFFKRVLWPAANL